MDCIWNQLEKTLLEYQTNQKIMLYPKFNLSHFKCVDVKEFLSDVSGVTMQCHHYSSGLITPLRCEPQPVVWRKRPKDLFVQGQKMWSRNPFYQLSDLTRLKQTIQRSQEIKQKIPCRSLFCFSDLSECNFLDCNIIVSDHLTN